jgi:hypothetical protein
MGWWMGEWLVDGWLGEWKGVNVKGEAEASGGPGVRRRRVNWRGRDYVEARRDVNGKP